MRQENKNFLFIWKYFVDTCIIIDNMLEVCRKSEIVLLKTKEAITEPVTTSITMNIYEMR